MEIAFEFSGHNYQKVSDMKCKRVQNKIKSGNNSLHILVKSMGITDCKSFLSYSCSELDGFL